MKIKTFFITLLIATICGVAVADVNDLYVAGLGDGNLHVYNGATSAQIGNPFFSVTANPTRVTFNPHNGNILVARNAQFVCQYTSTGTSGTFVGNLITSMPNGEEILGMAFGANGNLFISSRNWGTGSEGLREFNHSTGAFIRDVLNPSITPGYSTAFGLATGTDGKLYIAMRYAGNVWTLDGAGNTTALWSTSWANSQGFSQILDVTVAGNGDVYACSGNGVLVKWTAATSTASVIASGTGLGEMQGIAIGPDGNLYVSSYATNQIAKYSTTGTLLGTFATATYMPMDIVFKGIYPVCGDNSHPYPMGDLNKDCAVNFLDLSVIISGWLNCTAPDQPCDHNPI